MFFVSGARSRCDDVVNVCLKSFINPHPDCPELGCITGAWLAATLDTTFLPRLGKQLTKKHMEYCLRHNPTGNPVTYQEVHLTTMIFMAMVTSIRLPVCTLTNNKDFLERWFQLQGDLLSLAGKLMNIIKYPSFSSSKNGFERFFERSNMQFWKCVVLLSVFFFCRYYMIKWYKFISFPWNFMKMTDQKYNIFFHSFSSILFLYCGLINSTKMHDHKLFVCVPILNVHESLCLFATLFELHVQPKNCFVLWCLGEFQLNDVLLLSSSFFSNVP